MWKRLKRGAIGTDRAEAEAPSTTRDAATSTVSWCGPIMVRAVARAFDALKQVSYITYPSVVFEIDEAVLISLTA